MNDYLALTVRQPWASCFFLPSNPKDVENRSRRPSRGMIGQRLWIHSGLTLVREAIPRCTELGLEPPDENPLRAPGWPRGYILGSVLLVDCVEEHASPWRVKEWDGRKFRFAWVVEDPQPLSVPIPCKGLVSLGWRIPADVVARIEAPSG